MQNGYTDKDIALLIARGQDAAKIAATKNRPHFIGFLDEHQIAVLKPIASKQHDVKTVCFGGYNDAIRMVMGWFPADYPDEYEYFPLCAITLKWRNGADITHRDILGSLLSLGIERSTLGDILVGDNEATVLALDTVKSTILNELVKVGGEGVSVSETDIGDINYEQQYEEISGTVASLRIDAILSMCTHASRERVAEKIQAGYVSLNGMVVVKPSKEVTPGDIISVRGTGRFRCEFPDGFSRKGRIRLTVSKFK